jgi:hypothetical protein
MKKDTSPIDSTWMKKTGGFAKDMTLRDEFAARAMQGYLTGDYDLYSHEAANKAYAIADDMLAARDAE